MLSSVRVRVYICAIKSVTEENRMSSVTKCTSNVMPKDELAKIDKLVKDVRLVAQSKIGSSDKNIVLFGNRKEIERNVITVIGDICLYEYSYSQLELIEQVTCDSLLERGVCKQIQNVLNGRLWICRAVDEWDNKIRNAIYLYKLLKTTRELKVILILSESELDFANCATVKNAFDHISKIVHSPEKVFKNMNILITQVPTYKRSSIIEKFVSLEKKLLGKNCIAYENVGIIETGSHDKDGIYYALRGDGVIDLHPKIALDGIAHVQELLSHCMVVAEGYHLKLDEIILTSISQMTVSELDNLSKNISKYNTLEKFKPLIKSKSWSLYEKLLAELESITSVADFFKDVKHLENIVAQIKKRTIDLEHLQELIKFGYQARKSSNPAELQNIKKGTLQKFALSRFNKLKGLVGSTLKGGAFIVTIGFSSIVGAVLGMPVGALSMLKSSLVDCHYRRGWLGLYGRCVTVAVSVPFGAVMGAGAGAFYGLLLAEQFLRGYRTF